MYVESVLESWEEGDRGRGREWVPVAEAVRRLASKPIQQLALQHACRRLGKDVAALPFPEVIEECGPIVLPAEEDGAAGAAAAAAAAAAGAGAAGAGAGAAAAAE